MEVPVEAHYSRACRELEKMCAQFKRLHPIGSRVMYMHGYAERFATVVSHPTAHGLCDPYVGVEGPTGKRYSLMVSRIERAA